MLKERRITAHSDLEYYVDVGKFLSFLLNFPDECVSK